MRDAGHPGQARFPAGPYWGLGLAALCSGADVARSVYRPPSGSAVAVVVLGLAVLTLAATIPAWYGALWARNTVVSAQTVTALAGAPAFVLPAVPPMDVVISAVRLVAALVVAALLLIPRRIA